MARSSTAGLAKTIVLTGLLAGVLDASAAIIQYTIKGGKNPGNIFRFIASGVFGKKAFTGGIPMACWGWFFHFFIALSFTIFFFWLSPRLGLAGKNKVVTGLVYGVFVWMVMNLLVVPLSHTPKLPFQITQAAIAMLILMFCIGLPISLMANKYYLYKK